MSSDYARRGRPRGSGLDDRAQLRQIAELLEADPSLRPTTAIKAAGVSDPSTIRRLRDKLKAELAVEPSYAGVSSGSIPAFSADLVEAGPVSVEATPSRRAEPCAGGLAAVSASYSEAQFCWFTQWCALGLSAVSSAVEAQMAVMDDLVRVPPVEAALRQQLLLNEVAKALCPQRSDVRSTLH